MQRRWFLNRTNPEFIDYLSKTASVSPVLAQVLINRGIRTAGDVGDFLSSGITALSDPFGLPGMRLAVERVREASRRRERVLVHGDYDTDGLTAAAIMVCALRMIGVEAHYFIPHRMVHGYGFHPQAAVAANARLIITVDCGITSFEASSAAKARGIDVIITDHHEPLTATASGKGEFDTGHGDFVLPEALAVVNPKLMTGDSGLRELAGAGIAFKFAQALAAAGMPGFSGDAFLPLLDLAALGTVADVVPLTGENRIILKEGLEYIRNGKRPGIRALKEVSGLGAKEVKAGSLSFTMVPRVNAAGRLGDSGDVVRLLLSEKEDEAADLSAWLDGLNSDRQRIEEQVYQEAAEKLGPSEPGPVIILSAEGWHQGVLGIVASRMAEKYGRPAFILSVKEGVARGSARSIPAFDICRGLTGCRELLLSFGGHKQAAGLTMKTAHIPEFVRAMKDIMEREVEEDKLVPSLEIDASVRLADVTHALVKELELLEPTGYANPEPLLGTRDLSVVNPRIVGGRHLKLTVRKHSRTMDAIGFGMAALYDDLDSPAAIDAVFTPGINQWNGGRYLQLFLKAVRPSI
ncbi:MAG: single-stranded-DNA-specific exonuclease RecJ [Candidatus Sulfobium sp.]